MVDRYDVVPGQRRVHGVHGSSSVPCGRERVTLDSLSAGVRGTSAGCSVAAMVRVQPMPPDAEPW